MANNLIMNLFGYRNKTVAVPYASQLQVLSKHLPNTKICLIDIGAHDGAFTKGVASIRDIIKGVLIEPIPSKVQKLKVDFQEPRYVVYNNLVANEDNKKYPFFINKYSETSSILEINKLSELSDVDTRLESLTEIEGITLDTICEGAGVNHVDLLKIDVQGAEHLVLSGATNTLKFTKRVWIEVSFIPLYKDSAVFSEIYSFFKSQGFIMTEISPGHRSPSNDLLQADILFENTK
jgi:FkbM family methyltransferase